MVPAEFGHLDYKVQSWPNLDISKFVQVTYINRTHSGQFPLRYNLCGVASVILKSECSLCDRLRFCLHPKIEIVPAIWMVKIEMRPRKRHRRLIRYLCCQTGGTDRLLFAKLLKTTIRDTVSAGKPEHLNSPMVRNMRSHIDTARRETTDTTSIGNVKNIRLVVRTDEETRQLIARAAELSGRSVAEFLAYAAKKEARKVEKEAKQTVVSRKTADYMLSLLDNPQPLSPALRKAALNQRNLARNFQNRKNRKPT